MFIHRDKGSFSKQEFHLSGLEIDILAEIRGKFPITYFNISKLETQNSLPIKGLIIQRSPIQIKAACHTLSYFITIVRIKSCWTLTLKNSWAIHAAVNQPDWLMRLLRPEWTRW